MSKKDTTQMRKLSFLGFTRGENADENEAVLDEEMAKVFNASNIAKFDVRRLSEVKPPSSSKLDSEFQQSPQAHAAKQYNEQDYDSHRTKAYPQPYVPIKAARNMNRQPSKDKSPTSPISVVSDSDGNDVGSRPSNFSSYADYTSRDVSENIDDEEPPPLSERIATYYDDDESAKKVQFNKDKAKRKQERIDDDDDDEDRRRRKERQYHYKSRKYSLQEYNLDPRRAAATENGGRKISIQPEDATLEEADLDDLNSHRSEDPRGMRRPKTGGGKGEQYLQNIIAANKRNQIDHSPHEVFVQLDELHGAGEDREWKETARWIKYEEDVEEGADRWGRPHVASLSFHSLLNLRRCLETGVVLMDLDEKDLPGVAYRVVEQMVVEDLIHSDDKAAIMRALLLRHRHVNDHTHGSFHFGSRRKYSSYSSLQSFCCEDLECKNAQHQNFPAACRRSYIMSNILNNNNNRSRNPSRNGSFCHRPSIAINHGIHARRIAQLLLSPTGSSLPSNECTSCPPRRESTISEVNVSDERKRSGILGGSELNNSTHHRNGSSGDTKIDIKEETTYTSSQEDLKRAQHDSILKRIPTNSEATTVGAVDFLEQPTIAFVRLAEGCMMPAITEVPIPVRFLFILLGPKTADLDYHEVGRSIATLMSNRHFHNIAYKADDRRELLSAINEFLDDSIVLPPGKWDREQLLPFEELKAKSEMIRSRKKRALEQKLREKQPLTSEEEKKLLADSDGDGKKPPDDPLQPTGRWFGGMINDIKRRMPMYKSDIKDGLNTETLAATLFLYFAGLATAITFGGLVGSKTRNLIGISETLVSACFVGMVFHAFSSQPLVFVGCTGPLILFDEALIKFCDTNPDYDYLVVRLYVGLWLTVIALTVSAFEGSVYVRLFTRFTQEIFSALITVIYLVETALKLVVTYQRHPLLSEYQYKNMSRFEKTTPIPLLNSSLNEVDASFNDNTTDFISSTLQTTMSTIATSLGITSEGSNLLPPFDSDNRPINQPNTALFCTLLTLGTFTAAYSLKIFRNSKFLGRNARRALGDFGVPISIAVFVIVANIVPQVFTEKLNVPDGISPSEPSQRGWIIPWTPKKPYIPFMALIPALLVYILIFMETQISELIVGKPDRGLKKGNGLHWDINLLCFCNTICGIFGLPWHCAATVRSVTHVSAVTIMSTNHAPGDSPKVADIKEQRLSGFFVSLMIGLSIFASSLLKKIPMSVLFGIFLYMGVCSMIGVQFFERARLFFMPVKHHGTAPFVRRVPTWKMHVFTTVQVLALAMLWTVKSSSFSLAFPFFLIMMVPIRQQMAHVFTPLELRALDGSQAKPIDDDEPDFYEQAPLPA
ncbi:CLUMA_CG009689, isoform B [Clunio marinus]|uniref:Anion exchange protein n=1 Tax=Clunio marinus TaxID=568069 RepID=A0A1J1ICU7_9DIPT|nr:CLUMA_CG009689, isoform B [Clunio marinus]